LEPLVKVRILLPELDPRLPDQREATTTLVPMKLLKGERLFFGCKIDSKLREALAQAKPGERRYFDDPNGEFLRVLSFEEERWIGKVMSGGVNVSDVEDIQRNVVSILRRVAPSVRTSPTSIKIFAVSAEGEAVATDVEGEVEGESTPERNERGSGDRGPYIDYP
jgi:hypothetical protein